MLRALRVAGGTLRRSVRFERARPLDARQAPSLDERERALEEDEGIRIAFRRRRARPRTRYTSGSIP